MELVEQDIQCPYCGENITILVDDSVSQQDYVEDCQVCCRPIELSIEVGFSGEMDVRASTDSE